MDEEDFGGLLDPLLEENHPLLREISPSYRRLLTRQHALSNSLAGRLTNEELERFQGLQYERRVGFARAERYCFLYGIGIALRPYCGLPTPDFKALFDPAQRCLNEWALEPTPFDEKVEAALLGEILQNERERERDLRLVSLLRGYQLASACLREYDPGFGEDCEFSGQIAAAVLARIERNGEG